MSRRTDRNSQGSGTWVNHTGNGVAVQYKDVLPACPHVAAYEGDDLTTSRE